MTPEELTKRAREIADSCRAGVYLSTEDVAFEYVELIRSYTRAFRPFPSSIKLVEVVGMKIAISQHARNRMSERIPGTKNEKIRAIKDAVARIYDIDVGRHEALSDGCRWVFSDSEDAGTDMVLVTVLPI